MSWFEGTACFDIDDNLSTDECLVIRDLDGEKSVTNDAERVVEMLYNAEVLKPNQRLEYFDSEGRRDEILHDGTKFTGFQVLPQHAGHDGAIDTHHTFDSCFEIGGEG